jgi:hypothetical protein
MELLEALLQLNPKNRPSASEALRYVFLEDAQLVNDYKNVDLVTYVDEAAFDFEKNEYTLEMLQQMVRDEVSGPCDDSMFRKSPTTRKAPSMRRSPSNALHDHGSPEYSGNTDSRQNPVMTHNRTQSEQSSSEADEQYGKAVPEKRSYEGRAASEKIINQTDSSGNRRVLARSSSATTTSQNKGPPTPSPKKVESIAKQEKKQQRRFFLQGLQKITQGQQDQKVDPEGEELTARNAYIPTNNKISNNIIRPISHNVMNQDDGSKKGYEEVQTMMGKFEGVSLTARTRGTTYPNEFERTVPERKVSTAPPNTDSNQVTKLPMIQPSRSSKTLLR